MMTQADSVPIRDDDVKTPIVDGDASTDQPEATEPEAAGREHSALATSPLAQAALGVAAAVLGVVALIDASGLKMFGKHGVPGPGLFPTALSIVVSALGLALVVVSAVRRVRDGRAPVGQLAGVGRELRRAGGVWVGLLASIALMGLIGFVPATILLIAYLVLVVERIRNWKAAVVIVAVPVVAYALFVFVLGVDLPTSALFEGN
jgi:tripartite tricarboxylate transporter TctB family protein